MNPVKSLLRAALAVMVIAASMSVSIAPAAAAAGVIEGTVFRDVNFDGVMNASEIGAGGIEVTAVAPDGTVLGPVTSAFDGSYSLNVPEDTFTYRVQFALPATETVLTPGPVTTTAGTITNGSDVQFSTGTGPVAAGEAGVDFSIVNPANYCHDAVDVAVTCFVEGGDANGGIETIVSFNYDAPTAITQQADNSETGAVWGAAWRESSSSLFTSAFTKRHSEYAQGPGSIYINDPANPAAGATEFLDLDAILASGLTNPRTPGTDYVRDPDVWDAVGKTGLGDLEISEDLSRLYTVNLESRTLVEIPIGDRTASPVAPTAEGDADSGGVDSHSIPNPCATDIDFRPFGLGVQDGTVYVGMVCSGESTVDTSYYSDTPAAAGDVEGVDYQGPIVNDSQTTDSDPLPWEDPTGANKLGDSTSVEAHVFTFDPATETFSPAPVITMPLDFDRGFAREGANGRGGAQWNPWVPQWTGYYPINNEVMWPQPILADIEFDGNDMILAFNDRAGHQFGQRNFNTDPSDNDELNFSHSAGDLVRACTADGQSWTLENNSACPLPGGFAATAGAGTGQGSGGGEFYFDDTFRVTSAHDETAASGGIVQIAGRQEVLSTTYDLNAISQGSVEWFNNTTGVSDRGFVVYEGRNPLFGKANGLGDIEALCEAAPVQIGNFVWFDADGDGVQGPDEAPVVGATVNLYDAAGNVVATTTTDANGEYYFDVDADTDYVIRMDNAADYAAGGVLESWVLTTDSTDPSDQADSDGIAGSDGFPEITYTTGGPGANDHTLDFGFTPPVFDLALQKQLADGTNLGTVNPGGTVTFTLTIINQGATAAANITVTDFLPTGLTLADPAWTDQGDGTATTTITGPLAPAASTTVDIAFTVDADANGQINNWAEISAATDAAGNPVTDIDSTPNSDPADDTQPTGPNAPTDDEIGQDGKAGGDEDDHDVAGITVGELPAAPIFDLALFKQLADGTNLATVSPGDSVTFTMTVVNQGTTFAQDITVVDYLPSALSLNDAAWTDQGDGTATTTITGPLAPGASASVDITFTVNADASGSIDNWGEIQTAIAVDVNGIALLNADGTPLADIDSTPDASNTDGFTGDDATNGNGIAGGDEDDHDIAKLTIGAIPELAFTGFDGGDLAQMALLLMFVGLIATLMSRETQARRDRKNI